MKTNLITLNPFTFINDYFPLYTTQKYTNSKQTTNENYEEDPNTFSIDVPGFNKDNLEISIKNNILYIYGKSETREFNKSYSLNNYYTYDNITANIKDGILTIKFKKTEKNNTQKIIIE